MNTGEDDVKRELLVPSEVKVLLAIESSDSPLSLEGVVDAADVVLSVAYRAMTSLEEQGLVSTSKEKSGITRRFSRKVDLTEKGRLCAGLYKDVRLLLGSA